MEVEVESREGESRSASPRTSFSAELLNESEFISISPHDDDGREKDKGWEEFEFLSSNNSSAVVGMMSADQLFFEGKLLPLYSQRLSNINLKSTKTKDRDEEEPKQEREMGPRASPSPTSSWFVDDDPSPRPPKCTVLWKELLRLKKQRNASTLSPSSSSSSAEGGGGSKQQQQGKRMKTKGSGSGSGPLERTRSGSMRIRPMINVPICTPIKTNSLPPLFPLKKGRLLDRS